VVPRARGELPPARARGRVALALLLVALTPCSGAAASVIRVGAHGDVTTVAEAARQARDGDVVELEAQTYIDDVAVWTQAHLTIRAVGGRARLVARAAAAEAKAIFVTRGQDILVEHLEFAGAHVPDRNGAGIRHESGRLTVRDCLFEGNEMGLLTSNDPAAELVVERSEFRANRVADQREPGDPIGHQIYVGTIARFTLRESYAHGGAFGHLVKSRARESHVINNRLTDEDGGRASYELELPNGGVAYVLGNLIGQSATTQNPELVSFGAEGYTWPENALYLVNNTLVDGLRGGGRVLRVFDGAQRVDVIDNLVVGNTLEPPGAPGRFANNYMASPRDLKAPDRYDYRLRRASPLVGLAQDPGSAGGVALRPPRDYRHPLASRAVDARSYSPGAFQELAP
jgi:hypothetical protein